LRLLLEGPSGERALGAANETLRRSIGGGGEDLGAVSNGRFLA